MVIFLCSAMKVVCNQLVGVMLKYVTYQASHHYRQNTYEVGERRGGKSPYLIRKWNSLLWLPEEESKRLVQLVPSLGPRPKTNPSVDHFQFSRVLYWKRYTRRMRFGDETRTHHDGWLEGGFSIVGHADRLSSRAGLVWPNTWSYKLWVFDFRYTSAPDGMKLILIAVQQDTNSVQAQSTHRLFYWQCTWTCI